MWTFTQGHFTFLPITNTKSNTNWQLNSRIGFDKILHSDLPESLKGQLLPFYLGESIQKDLSQNTNKKEAHKFAYELLFGSPMLGNAQILSALDIALSLEGSDESLNSLARSLILKLFVLRDGAGDSMLAKFLSKHSASL